jgi:signal transduction histidine kinase
MKPSLRLRIALLSTVLSGMVMVMFGAGAWWVVERQKTAALDARIRALGSRQPGWVFRDRDFQRLEENLDFVLTSPDDATPYFLMVADAAGRILHQSAHWPGDLTAEKFTAPLADSAAGEKENGEQGDHSPVGRGPGGLGRGRGGGGGGGGGGPMARFDKAPEFSHVTTNNQSWRVGRLGSTEFTLVIGLSADATAAELRQLRNAAAIALPVALLLIGLGGWVVAGRALRPLEIIADTASHVTARGLDQRVPTIEGDPEITRLVDMLNGMMDRLELGFRQATRFSADASHELKTPLAIMRGELEQAVQRAGPGSPEQRTFNSLLEETHRLGGIIRSLLLLSRADAGRLVTTWDTVDLTNLVSELMEDAAVSAEAAGIRVESHLAPAIRISGDADLLRTAIVNLLGNSVKHNQQGGRVTVRLAGEKDGHAILEIANTGTAITPEERHDIFERFHRGRGARDHARDGVGLGLSLAREIITSHGGSLILADDQNDGLVCFTAKLPLK